MRSTTIGAASTPKALRVARRLHLPNFFWEHLFIAMICGQLGRAEEAQTALARLLALRPDLATAAAEVIGIIVLDPALVAHCVEGLRKAGLLSAPHALGTDALRNFPMV
ncbi:MAG: hypothetical protein P9F75_04015 [Candidatus Contendobacter sp.]|nr:hypothetical protein [Candidatus Contendobacter sp.]